MSKKQFGLERRTFKKNRQWAVDNLDQDLGYIKDLKKKAAEGSKEAKEALDYLAKFNNEYYNNTGMKNEDSLHNTDELRKDRYNSTNAANRDLYSISDSVGLISSMADEDQLDEEAIQPGMCGKITPVKIKMEEPKNGEVKEIKITKEETEKYLSRFKK